MKQHVLKTIGGLLLLGTALSSFEACKVKDPLEGVAITTKADFVSASSYVFVKDVGTGEAGANFANAKLTFSGPGAATVYSSGGKKAITMSADGGIQFAFRRGTVATAEKPLLFDIMVEIPGYRTEIIPMRFTSINPQTSAFNVLNLANLPKGLGKASGSATADASGTVTAETSLILPSSADKPIEASLTIPAGTKLLDKEGNAVTGTVTTDVIQTAITSQEAANSVGNISNLSLKNADGSPSNLSGMIPFGSMDINMTAGSAKVKSFSQAINAKMELNPESLNPTTGQPIKEGETIDIISRNDGESNWNIEGTTTIKKDANGKLYAEFPVNHLSTWSLSKLYGKCTGSAITTQDLSGLPNPSSTNVEITIEQPVTTIILIPITMRIQGVCENQPFLIQELNELINLPITNSSTKFNSIFSSTLCGSTKKVNQDIILTNIDKTFANCAVTSSTSNTTTSPLVKGKFRGKCTNGNSDYVTLPAGSTIRYAKRGVTTAKDTWSSISVSVEGTYNIGSAPKSDFVAGEVFTFAVMNDGQWYTYDYTFPVGNANNIPDEITVELGIPCE